MGGWLQEGLGGQQEGQDCRGAQTALNIFNSESVHRMAQTQVGKTLLSSALVSDKAWCSLRETIRPAFWAVSGCSVCSPAAAAPSTATAATAAAVSKEMSPVAPSLVP